MRRLFSPAHRPANRLSRNTPSPYRTAWFGPSQRRVPDGIAESVRLEDGQKQNEARLPVPRLVDQNGFRIAHPTSSRMAFFTWVGTGAYLRGSMTLLARPVLMERSSVV